MQPRISMITLGVDDIGESIRFYEQGLGFPRLPAEDDKVAFFSLNGSWLGLYPRHLLARDAGVTSQGRGSHSVTLAHNVQSREEVDEVMIRALAAGATLVKTAKEVFWGGYVGYFADPDGFLWEIAWNPHFWPGPADEAGEV